MQRCVLTMTVVVLASAGFAPAAEPPKPETPPRAPEMLKAYQALRDAVDLVESTHAPDVNVYIPESPDVWFGERRPRIGVVVRTSDFGEEPVGAVIDAVTPGGPADEAGLEAGDVITHVDGRPLAGETAGAGGHEEAAAELVEWSRGLNDGQTVTIEYVRDGRPATVTLEAREMMVIPRPPAAPRLPESWKHGGDGFRFFVEPSSWVFPSAWLDMELVALNPDLGEYFSSDRGVLVVRAPDDESLGLEAGDVILAIGGRDVRDPSHAMRILRSYEPDEELAVDIVRHGRSQTLVGTVPQPNVELFDGVPMWRSEDD
jgi:S1-C subfamily serine protease